MTEQKFQFEYAEAYALMTYSAEQMEDESEVIWNSRDGVTPFVITLRSGKTATQTRWNDDVRSPGHKPAVGDRIFVDLTWEDGMALARQRAHGLWEQDPYPGHPQELYDSYDAFLAVFQEGIRDEVERGAPHLVTVTESMARERGWL